MKSTDKIELTAGRIRGMALVCPTSKSILAAGFPEVFANQGPKFEKGDVVRYSGGSTRGDNFQNRGKIGVVVSASNDGDVDVELQDTGMAAGIYPENLELILRPKK